MPATPLIVPGLHGSGPQHWQSWLETRVAGARRVQQADWERPALEVWAQAVGDEIDRAAGPVILVAHSFGCLAAVHAAASRQDRVAAALLVAPAEPERFSRHGLRGDAAAPGITDLLPATRLGFPSLLVASSNDPWLSPRRAEWLAERWGSRLLCLGAVGHINVDSGFGPWPQGLALLESLRKRSAGEFTAPPAKPGAVEAPDAAGESCALAPPWSLPTLLRKFA